MTRSKNILKDDRKEGCFPEYTRIVVGKDAFLSGWGHAEGKTSYAGWACKPEDVNTVEAWVKSRSDMRHVAVKPSNWLPASSGWHFHIYVVDEDHPALQAGV